MTKDEALDRKAENARELGLDYEPERTWVGLTPEEIDEIIENAIDSMDALLQTMDKLKEKNT